MDTHFLERYRDETRRLVAMRGVLCATLFAVGAAIAGVIEYRYSPERLPAILGYYGLEVAICLVAIGSFRLRRLHRLSLLLTHVTCTAVLVCVTLYVVETGASTAAAALLFIVFELTAALMFPWGLRGQVPMAVACVGLFCVVGTWGSGDTLPLAYQLYAVAAASGLSIHGAAFLERQRRMLFTQREQLDQHIVALRDLTLTFHGFDPQRVLLLTSTSLLQVFRLRRLWAVWRAPASGPIPGYFAQANARDEVTLEALPDPEALWAAVVSWSGSTHGFVARGADPRIPDSLRRADVTSVLCLPIRFEGECLGAICADRGGEPLGLGERELGLASALAGGAAIAIANARLYQQVTEASEEKSTFLARIAHELRNPLHTLLWDIDTLQADEAGPERILDRLRKNTLMTLEAATELQEFSEVETKRLRARLERVELAQVFEDLQATTMALVEGRSITFRSHVGPGAEALVTDPVRLRQILGNLLSNAAKFTREGTVELAAERAGAEVAIRVRDTGCGIEESDLASVFAPFYRGSTQACGPTRGMGLGLSIAQELAGLLGGRIEVESRAGVGSTFRLVLPVGDAAPRAPAVVPPAAAASVVLLVEDDAPHRTRVADGLRQSGARVIEAGDGFEGLRRAREESPDVIVLDLGLPGLGGIDVLGHLKRDRRTAPVPVVVATGDRDRQHEAHCRQVGVAAYLLKPYTPEDLRAIVTAVVEQRLETAV
jgi:signal transduction histidine kinase/CheY-like chemotaxis protein